MPRFAVRICGVEVANVTVRLVVGSGGARHEIVFEDPILGLLPLDDTLTIEIWRLKGPLARQKWQTTDVRGLYAELILSGAIDVVGAGDGEKRAC
ncbi:MAG: hypothetical protein WB625_02105 [Candidatus Sulfotelmatobacter sp.]|jgi:hypothetical protein